MASSPKALLASKRAAVTKAASGGGVATPKTPKPAAMIKRPSIKRTAAPSL